MKALVKNLKHDRKVIFDTGKFDDWCVYVVEANGWRKAPYDVTYFNELRYIAHFYPLYKVYNDFVLIYERTTKQIESKVINQIDALVATYRDEHKLVMEQWLAVLYAGMIAEENKTNAILKKRVKRLGMHQVLVEGMDASIAANYSKGKKWRELDQIMKKKGF